MEKEEKSQRTKRSAEQEILLQWGNKKRNRCSRTRDPQATTCRPETRKTSSRVHGCAHAAEKDQPNRLSRSVEAVTIESCVTDQKASAMDKEDRHYTTRGSISLDENGRVSPNNAREDKGLVWPKLHVSLSNKEKEEDFMAMKGCKLPQRPKKRAKTVQRSLLLMSPGAWLTDMCQERYEVREKKSSKKRPRGLKAMGSMESDSE